MKEHFADFLCYIKSEKGLSSNTIEAYQRDIHRFISFLEDGGITSFSNVTSSLVINYIAGLKAFNYACASVYRALIAIKVFFRFLKREGIVAINVCLYLDSPKLWLQLPQVLSLSEVYALLQAPDDKSSMGIRDRAIIETLYACGLRVSELCTLTIYDVDDAFVKVMGKGRKERIVPIAQSAIQAIDRYLLHSRHLFNSEKTTALFVSQKGTPITRIQVWKRIKLYARKAGITKNISPHTLRHSFATHLLDNGADLRIIQEMMGHATITSTDHYMHLSRNHLHSAFEKFHPRK